MGSWQVQNLRPRFGDFLKPQLRTGDEFAVSITRLGLKLEVCAMVSAGMNQS